MEGYEHKPTQQGKLTHTVVTTTTTTTMCIDAYGCTCTQQHTHADMMQMQWRQCNEMKPNQKRSSRQTDEQDRIDLSVHPDRWIDRSTTIQESLVPSVFLSNPD